MRLLTNTGLAWLLASFAASALAQEPQAQPAPTSAPKAPVTISSEDEAVDIASSERPLAQDGEVDVAGEAFARMDSNRDGQLSLEEFEQGIRRPRGSQGEGVIYQKLPARFRALDLDTSGYLESNEFEVLVQRWRGPGPVPALAPSDRSGDGRIDFREFAALMAPRDEEAAAATP